MFISGGAARARWTGGSLSLYCKVQCIMDNGQWDPPVDRQTDTTEKITFMQLR